MCWSNFITLKRDSKAFYILWINLELFHYFSPFLWDFYQLIIFIYLREKPLNALKVQRGSELEKLVQSDGLNCQKWKPTLKRNLGLLCYNLYSPLPFFYTLQLYFLWVFWLSKSFRLSAVFWVEGSELRKFCQSVGS